MQISRGRTFQKEGIGSAKILRQLCAWCIKGTVRSPVWPSRRNVMEDKIREVTGPDPIKDFCSEGEETGGGWGWQERRLTIV